MRRSLAALLFVAAAASLSVSAASWWLQHTVFDPDSSEDIANAVLQDETIRRQIATVIADHTARRLNLPPTEVRSTVERVAETEGGGAVMGRIVAQAHARLIGLRDEPVRIGPRLLVRATRNERVAVLPAVTLPVEEVRPISIVRESTSWLIPISAAAGALLLVLALFTHPARADAIYGLGTFLVFAGLMAVLLGYVVPVALVPALSNSTWTAAVPLIAKQAASTLFVGAGVLVAAGIAVVAGSARLGRRRQWKTPVTTRRYYDQRHWS